MHAYILSIAGVVLLSAVVSVVAPGGKTGAFIKGMMRLVTFVVMVAPIGTFFVREDPTAEDDTKQPQTDIAYLERCADLLAEADERIIAAALSDEYGVTAEVEVQRNADSAFSYKMIHVNILDFGIIGADEHIYMISRIEEALTTYYRCDAEVA